MTRVSDSFEPPGSEKFRRHADSCLIVIDMQRDFCCLDGARARAGHRIADVSDVVARQNLLIGTARSVGVPVVFVRTHHSVMTDSPRWVSRTSWTNPAELPTRAGSDRIDSCVPGSRGADFYGVEPEASDPIVTKHRYSAFIGTDLDLILRAQGIRTIYFAGVATDICVESSLRDAVCYDYDVVLVSDCCASPRHQAHIGTVELVSTVFGRVEGSAQICREWLGEPTVGSGS